MMRKTIFYLFLVTFSVIELHSQSLPVYSRADLWYRSNELDTIGLNWTDISKNEQAARAGNAYSVSDSSYNFHKSIRFNDSTDQLEAFYPVHTITRLTVVSVFNVSDTMTEHGVWSLDVDGKQLTGLSDRQLIREKSSVTFPIRRKEIPIIHTSVQSFSKKRGDTVVFTLGNCVLPDSTTAYFRGNMAECMVFDKFLKKAELLRIETYLAIKYGITLVASNYVTPYDTIIWNYDSNRIYSNAIAGIGRDSIFGLHQRQSNSVEDNGLLTIGKGAFCSLNRDNTDSLPEGSYLIWGDNNEALSCENIYDSIPLWERKWMMQVTKGNTLSTNVKLKAPYWLQNSNYYLVIDRSGRGTFDSLQTEYKEASYVDSNGYVYFENIVWDTDYSGKDVFTFSPGQVHIGAMSVQLPDTGCKNLGMRETYDVEKGEQIALSANANCVKGVHYQWSKNGKVISESEKVSTDEEGDYTLTVTLADGTTQTGNTTLSYASNTIANEFCTYKVYPNPSQGDYTVEVKLLEPSDITIRTYTVNGSLLREQKDKEKTFYTFDGHLESQGYYFIDIITKYEKKTIKIVISK